MNMMNDGHFVSETHGQQNNGDMEKKARTAFAAKAKAVALLLLLLLLLLVCTAMMMRWQTKIKSDGTIRFL